MKIEECGNEKDKTRVEICELLRKLGKQLTMVVDTIESIERTLYNEEYD